MTANNGSKSLLATINDEMQPDADTDQQSAIVSDSDIPDEIANELAEFASKKKSTSEGDRKKTYVGLTSKRFSPEDLKAKNPLLFEKFYIGFNHLGIAEDQKALQQFVKDYMEWLKAFKAEKAEAEKGKKQAKLQKALSLLGSVDKKELLELLNES